MMASITDCVVEGLKYPFNDIKKLLVFGASIAIICVLSVFSSVKSVNIFRSTIHSMDVSNATLSTMQFSQLPVNDIYMLIVLGVIGFIVSLFVMGYQYDVVKFSINRKADLPGFSDIIGMFVRGIKYFIVALAYMIIPTLILAGGIVLFSNYTMLLVTSLISMILYIIAFFIMIMALNNMIAHDSIKKAFDFGEIMDNISNLGWGKYIGIIIFTLVVQMIIMAAASFILSFITALFAMAIGNQVIVISLIIAIIQGLFINSYCSVFLSRVFGSVYRESIK